MDILSRPGGDGRGRGGPAVTLPERATRKPWGLGIARKRGILAFVVQDMAFLG